MKDYLLALSAYKEITMLCVIFIFCLGWAFSQIHTAFFRIKEKENGLENLGLYYYIIWFYIFLFLTIMSWPEAMIFKPFSGYSLIFVMLLLFIILPFVKELDICGVKANFDFFQKGKQLDKKEQQAETKDLSAEEAKSIKTYKEELKKLLEEKKTNRQRKRENFHV